VHTGVRNKTISHQMTPNSSTETTLEEQMINRFLASKTEPT